MLKNLKPAHVTLIKYAAIAGVAVFAYYKVKNIGSGMIETVSDVAATTLNPVSDQNAVNQAVTAIVGKEQLRETSTGFFDAVDSVFEFFGSEKGINGIAGTTADAERLAGNKVTKKFGANSNG